MKLCNNHAPRLIQLLLVRDIARQRSTELLGAKGDPVERAWDTMLTIVQWNLEQHIREEGYAAILRFFESEEDLPVYCCEHTEWLEVLDDAVMEILSSKELSEDEIDEIYEKIQVDATKRFLELSESFLGVPAKTTFDRLVNWLKQPLAKSETGVASDSSSEYSETPLSTPPSAASTSPPPEPRRKPPRAQKVGGRRRKSRRRKSRH